MSPNTKEWENYRREIDKRLNAIRPQRAGVGEREWREPVYGWARNHIPDESNLVHNFAARIVDQREGQATKIGNLHLRGWLHGVEPLDWSVVGPYPVRVGKLRIRLDAVTPDELEDAARELRAAGQIVWNEVLLLHDGMLDLARAARRQGLATVAKLGDQEPREQPQAA